jgi:hypothetical protein
VSIVVAVIILIAVVGIFALIARAVVNRDMTGRDDRPLGDTPEAHDELNPHDVPKWDRATRGAAEEQSGGLEGETGGNREGEAGGEPMPQGGTAERGG